MLLNHPEKSVTSPFNFKSKAMKPGEKGWLTEYLEFREELLKDLASNGHKSSHPEHSLYRIVQPTGLMYGQSVDILEHPDSKNWDQKDRMKIACAREGFREAVARLERAAARLGCDTGALALAWVFFLARNFSVSAR